MKINLSKKVMESVRNVKESYSHMNRSELYHWIEKSISDLDTADLNDQEYEEFSDLLHKKYGIREDGDPIMEISSSSDDTLRSLLTDLVDMYSRYSEKDRFK